MSLADITEKHDLHQPRAGQTRRGVARLSLTVVAVLVLCGGHAARADRAVHCKEEPNIFRSNNSPDEITIQQLEGSYQLWGDPAKVIFESDDRRKVVLYFTGRFSKEDEQLVGPRVLIVTVDFQSLKVVTYSPPLGLGLYGSRGSGDIHVYQGCERLD